MRNAASAVMFIALFALAPFRASAQKAPSPTPAEIAKSMLEEASTAPVEIYAEIALGPKLLPLLSKSDQAATLERVFLRAGEAREQWPLLMAVTIDSGPAADRATKSYFRLDSLSIRCRVVQALLGIDPKLARTLFEEIARPNPPKANCSDILIPDASIYAETLAAVAERGAFSDEERKKGGPWLLVERGLTGISGVVELVAAARAFAPLVKSAPQAETLSTKLAIAMSQPDADRAFTYALRRAMLISPLLKVGYAARENGASDSLIITALRGYLTRQLSGTRCRDNAAKDRPADAPTVEAFAEYLGERTDIAPITAEERMPSRIEGAAAPSAYANAAEFAALSKEVEDMAGFPTYRRGPAVGFAARPIPARGDFPAARARDALSKIEDLKPVPGQDPLEVFHEKCRLMGNMLTAPLSGEARRVAIGDTADIFGDPSIMLRAPAEWLLELRDLVAQTRTFELLSARETTNDKAPAPVPDLQSTGAYSDLVQSLADSRVPALSLFVRIERFDTPKQ